MFVAEIILSSQFAWVSVLSSSNLSLKHAYMNLHVCTVHQWRLKHFIIQQMHKYIIRRYDWNYYKIFEIAPILNIL